MVYQKERLLAVIMPRSIQSGRRT